MRVSAVLLLTVLVFSGANGGFLDSLSSAFSGLGTTLHSVFDPVLSTALDAGKQIGANILSQAQQAGSLLLSQTAQNVLGVLQPTATPPAPMPATQGTTPHPDLIPSKRDTKDVHGILMAIAHKANNVLQAEAGQLDEYLQNTINDFTNVVNAYAERQQTSMRNVLKQIQQIVDTHKWNMETYLHRISVRAFYNITHDFKDSLAKIVPLQQRSTHLSEIFSLLSHQVASFFSPHITKISQMVDILSNTLKETVFHMERILNDQIGGEEQAMAVIEKASSELLDKTLNDMKMKLLTLIHQK